MNTILEQINSAGYRFVEFMVPMLVQSAVLIAVLLLADLLLRKKVRAVVRYWLWMLVLIKLVLPTTLYSPLSLGSWFGDAIASIKVNDTSVAAQPVTLPQVTEAKTSVMTVASSVDIKPIVSHPSGTGVANVGLSAVSPAPLTWQGIVFLVWVAVVVAMGLLLLQRAIFVIGLVAQAQNPTQLMNETFNFCCGQMGIKSKVGLKVSANTASPAVCGLFRPVILVPQNLAPTLGSSRLRPILLHELAHVRRGDLWINLVQTILQIIYFYNPLLWLANSIIRRVREQAVDEAVQVAMGDSAPQYPQTLVDVAKIAFSRPVLSLRLIGVVESKSALKGRIKRMLDRPIPKTAKLGILGLISLSIFAAVFLPMAKAESGPPEFVIKGTVTNANTGQPVAGAKVGDNGYAEGKQCTITDANGFYSYNTWYEEHNIKCEASGYKTQNGWFGTKIIGSEKEKVLDFALEPSNSPENSVEGKKQPSGTSTKKAQIAAKLEALTNQRDSLQKEVDLAEGKLEDVRRRYGISDLEEHNYPPPIVERLNRLQKEQDDCALEVSQLKARIENLKKGSQSDVEKKEKELEVTQNRLIELQSKFDALEKMRTEASAKKEELDVASVQYKREEATKVERLQRLNEVKAEIEELKLMYDNPAAFDAQADIEPAPYTQEVFDDIQPDGTCLFKNTISQTNQSGGEISSTGFINSDFVHVTGMSDAKGKPLKFTSTHEEDIYRYKVTFNEPVLPGEVMEYTSEGTMDGLVKPVPGSKDTFQYYMQHWPQAGRSTRRVETYLLPAGAELISKTPEDMQQQTKNGRIELHVEKMIPPGGSITTAFQYRLTDGKEPDRIVEQAEKQK